jgi:hypothetical protein
VERRAGALPLPRSGLLAQNVLRFGLGMMQSAQPQVDFLRALLFYGDIEERRRLIEKVVRASREERWSRRGLGISVLLTLVYFYGLSFLSTGIPAEDPSVWGDLAGAGGVGLLLCVAVFLGHWLWQRGFLHRVEDESRRFALGVLESCSQSRGPRLPLMVEKTFQSSRSARRGSLFLL